jgi:hypothetical protein
MNAGLSENDPGWPTVSSAGRKEEVLPVDARAGNARDGDCGTDQARDAE